MECYVEGESFGVERTVTFLNKIVFQSKAGHLLLLLLLKSVEVDDDVAICAHYT